MEIINILGNVDKLSFLPEIGNPFAVVQFYHETPAEDVCFPNRYVRFLFRHTEETLPEY